MPSAPRFSRSVPAQPRPPVVGASGEKVLTDWGFTPEAITGLRQAYKLLYKSDLSFDQAKAEIAAQMDTLLRSGKLPAPQAVDREAIAAVLEDIAALTVRAGPLKEDIARLLAAFGDTP